MRIRSEERVEKERMKRTQEGGKEVRGERKEGKDGDRGRGNEITHHLFPSLTRWDRRMERKVRERRRE